MYFFLGYNLGLFHKCCLKLMLQPLTTTFYFALEHQMTKISPLPLFLSRRHLFLSSFNSTTHLSPPASNPHQIKSPPLQSTIKQDKWEERKLAPSVLNLKTRGCNSSMGLKRIHNCFNQKLNQHRPDARNRIHLETTQRRSTNTRAPQLT